MAFAVGEGLSDNVEDNNFYWRIVLGGCIIFPVFRSCVLFMFYRLDTPYYYLMKNEEDFARRAVSEQSKD